jgi:plasmid stabilization system protein ParE
MNYSLRFEPEAEADLQQSYDWYTQQRPALGIDFLEAVEGELQQLLVNPTALARVVGEARHWLMRRFPYVICYVVEGETVCVVAVFHSRRDPTAWQSRVT